MHLIPTPPDAPRVLRYLETATDPVDDLLLWADVASPLGRLSRVWLAEAEGEAVGVAFAFPLWPALPSLGLHGRSPALERAMLDTLVAQGAFTHGYVICPSRQFPLYQALGNVEGHHREAHMTLAASSWQPRPISGVRPATLPELDAFYREHRAGAWHPAQFETGPYLVAEDEGRIVAAAGTHFAYGALAQVGNVLTAPAHRGRGHARRVTEAVTRALVERGHQTISLFVAEGNTLAVGLYERLGYRLHTMREAFAWRAPQAARFRE